MIDESYDVVVLGGGIHGAGVAQAAAASGHHVLLLEKSEPAAGTSSRSSKLIHGGLRYLESFEFSLVRESLRERKLLLKNASSLVQLIPFYIPIYKETKRRPWQIRIGLSLYALLGGFGCRARFRTLPRTNWDQFPGLKTDRLQKIFQYSDAQTDDAALTRAVLRSAEILGAKTKYPARFLAAERNDGGYQVHYQFENQDQNCQATVLVNAAGPWINNVRDQISPPPPHIEIDLVQGAHILFDKPIADGILYTEAPQDGRAVFIMPWQDQTLVGTTETAFTGSPDDVRAVPEEIFYLEETLNHYFPNYSGSMTGSFAGLRVLPRAESSLSGRSRETIFVTDSASHSRYVGIYGGKLTGYRATAIKVMKLIEHSLPTHKSIAKTELLKLGESEQLNADEF